MVVDCPAAQPIPSALPTPMVMNIPHTSRLPSRAVSFELSKWPAMRNIRKVPPFGSAASWNIYHLSAPFVVVGDSFDEGLWIVKIQWLTYMV